MLCEGAIMVALAQILSYLKLMELPNGLHGYLVDDLIQNVYPQAPSLRTFTGPTDNADDERMAIYRWQRQIWRLMNEKKTPAVQ